MRGDEQLVGSELPGRFRLEQLIGAGSFGSVYRARQLAVDRDVAIKILHRNLDPASEDGLLFADEIRAVGRIDHPAVVRVFQADVAADGRLFFAMELLDGRDLQSIADAETLAPHRAVEIVHQLLGGLDAAHRAGLTHADVKPGNVMVVAAGAAERVVLLDFGFARQQTGRLTPSAGGTPAFMAPEQLTRGLVDPRSDQFAAALVLLYLLTGWRRTRASELVPPVEVLATIEDRAVRAALHRALALEPEDRFSTAAELAEALGERSRRPPRLPFVGLVPLTELDRTSLQGRDRELAQLVPLVLDRRLVIVTGPSGVGKSSLLRAGLVPRLGDARASATYVTCRDSAVPATVSGQVLVVDQVEDAIHAGASPVVAAWLRVAPPHVVLGVREDFLARLLEQLGDHADDLRVFRLGPLEIAGARAAIEVPLRERGIAVEDALMTTVLHDLVEAARPLDRELGWHAGESVYPPHLQLVCHELVAHLGPDDPRLTLRHYDALGGFEAIVGQHFDGVLDRLDDEQGRVAKAVLGGLVGDGALRAVRTDEELTEALPAADRGRAGAILEMLRREGLVVRVRRPTGEAAWELIHDSVIPRVVAWADRRDLSRRRVAELVRHHLRRSAQGVPSLLTRPELRDLEAHPGVVRELDEEWHHGRRDRSGIWSASRLVDRSRLVHRRSRIASIGLVAAVVLGALAMAWQRRAANLARDAELMRRDQDLGLVQLELSVFDWDSTGRDPLAVELSAVPQLDWSLRRPLFDDPSRPGLLLEAPRVRRVERRFATDGRTLVDVIEVAGGPAFLVVDGRGRPGEQCGVSVVPLRALPGYARRGAGPTPIQIAVPSCRASTSGLVTIPGGPFWFGGVGTPASSYAGEFVARVTPVVRPQAAFLLGRTEVTNAELAPFAALRALTGIAPPSYMNTNELARADDPRSPVTGMTWFEARTYCEYLGLRLPSSYEWEKALRGGIELDGAVNPTPQRNFPWGSGAPLHRANLADEVPQGTRLVGSYPDDRSPYGVLDLAGNVMEWIGTPPAEIMDRAAYFAESWRVARGGNWNESPSNDLENYMAIENRRPGNNRSFLIGWRCAGDLPVASPATR